MEIDETKYGYVYRITNLVNGKTYIGQHKIVKGEKWLSYMGSGRLIRLSLKKYGKSNFAKQLIYYAESKKDLDKSENKFIQEELLKGKSEYNIYGSEKALLTKLEDLNFTDEQLLSWYFDDCMSYENISYKLNCSISVIHSYMKKLKEIDSRFENISQSNNINRYNYDVEELKNRLLKTQEKIECENCSKKISYSNYSAHLKACVSEDYFNGFRKHKCANNECDTLIYVKNVHCQRHFSINGFPGISTPDSVIKGGKIAAHNRWHVKRNKVSEICELCQENLIQ